MSPSRIYKLVSKKQTLELNEPAIDEAVNDLTEEDLANIDENAIQLSKTTGVDGDVAFALAFESFATGASQCRAMLTAKEDMHLGASLNNLFKSEDDIEWMDLELVTAYALDMEHSGGIDESIAYGVALDSYLADPALFRSKFATESPVNTNSSACDNKSSPVKDRTEDGFFGASLNRLFRLPAEFVGGDKELNDIDLVTAYGEELERNGGVDPAAAYGVALDAFIADPCAFRKQFGCSAAEPFPEVVDQPTHDDPVPPPTPIGPNELPAHDRCSPAVQEVKAKASATRGRRAIEPAGVLERAEPNVEVVQVMEKPSVEKEATPVKSTRRRGRSNSEQEDMQPPAKRSTKAKKSSVDSTSTQSTAKSSRGKKAAKVFPQVEETIVEVASDEEIALAILCDGYVYKLNVEACWY